MVNVSKFHQLGAHVDGISLYDTSDLIAAILAIRGQLFSESQLHS
jgi:hypothetical protein